MQITDVKKIQMYLGDYRGAVEDIQELTDAILEFTDKPVAVSVLLDNVISLARFAGESWAKARILGFEGVTQDALLEKCCAVPEEDCEDVKGGENDQ